MSTEWGMTKVTRAIKNKRDSNQQVSQGCLQKEGQANRSNCAHHISAIHIASVCIPSAVRCMPGVTWIKRHGTAHIPHNNTIPSCKGPQPTQQSHPGFKPKSPPPQWHTAICSTSPYYDHVKTISHNGRSFSTSKIQYSYQVHMSQPSNVVVHKWLWTKGWGTAFCASLHHHQLFG